MVSAYLPLLAAFYSLFITSIAKDWESPEYTWLYQFPLPIPPAKTPKRTITNPVTGGPIDYYEVEIKPLEQQVYPTLGKARLVGYDGISPGPTFLIEKGREAVVRFINHGDLANSVHLHGSYSRAPFDGWAEDITPVGSYKDYYYPNSQSARTLWYHDHAIDHTAENAYYGQAGVYLLHDPAEDVLKLPSGYGKYDIPIVLSAKQYNSDGSLFSPAAETTSLYGDVIHVNGQPWPFFKVEPRKYRFRFLDASISRSFKVYLEKDTAVGTKLPFDVIASDAGLLSYPVPSNDLTISMAERWEIVVDFAPFKGQNLTLRNTEGFAADTDYLHTNKVMKFVVGDTVSDTTNNDNLPSTLRTVPFPPDRTAVDHHFRFESSNGQWQINGVTFADPVNRLLANCPRGSVEVWELENSSGGWTHPIHVHLVDMKIIKRTGGDNRGILPYEAVALKDVVWLGKGETVTVEAHFAPWDGLYMFHCHNLIHEDHEMMAAFDVDVLKNLGYNETQYLDPMEQRWRATPEIPADLTDTAIEQKVLSMASLQPYNKVNEIYSVLETYWETATTAAPTAPAAPTVTTVPTATAAPATTQTTSSTSKTSVASTLLTTTKSTTTKTSTAKTTTTK